MHVNQPFCYEPEQREEERTYEDLKARYDDATSKYTQSELVLNGLDNELKKVKEEVIATIRKAHKTLQRLDEIALNPDPLSETDYIKLCIEAEKREPKPGWKERVEYFEELLVKNGIISEVLDFPRSNIGDSVINDSGDAHHDTTQSDPEPDRSKLHSILAYSSHSTQTVSELDS
jgi:hypothetical protein